MGVERRSPGGDPVWPTQKQRYSGFADYESQTTRTIPVIILERTG